MTFSDDRITVLCVDDEPLVLNALARALSFLKEDIHLVTVNSGSDALQLIETTDVGVAFIDLIMPKMDGLELLKIFKQRSPNTEMVMITAEEDPLKVVAAMKAGATDYLTKPIDNQRLRTVTANLIRQHRLETENRRLWNTLRQQRERAFAQRPIRILIVDNNPEDALLVRRLFAGDSSSRYEIVTISSGEEVLPVYFRFNPDCIILEFNLPDATGTDVLSLLSDDSGRINVAVVVLTGQGDEKTAAAAMNAGAADFLVKRNITSELLHRSVFSALEKMDLLRKARKQEEETSKTIRILEVKRNSLAYDVNHDPLTGVFNRRGMHKFIKKTRGDQHEWNEAVSLAMCDIDYFKQINDSHGHQVGDEILVGVVKRLQNELRKVDRICRYGGEEFLLFIADSDRGIEPFERLRRAVSDKPFSTREGKIPITISIGVAPQTTNLDIGIAVADSALYDAKARGRNQVIMGSRASDSASP